MPSWLKLAGTAIAVAVMAAVLYLYGGDIRKVDLSDPALLPPLGATIALYVSVILIGAYGWRISLTAFGETLPALTAERHLLVSQIGKYFPGNVVHFAGRAALAMKAGVPGRTIGAAMMTETAANVLGGLTVAAASFALVPALRETMTELLPEKPRIALLVAGLLLFFGFLAVMAYALHRRRPSGHVPPVRLSRVALVVVFYIICFLLLGLSLDLIVDVIAPDADPPISLSTAVFALAWVAGLVTPGAPGGIGVRESVLTLGLTPAIGGPEALTVALVHRAACIVGDVISFGIGLGLPQSRD